MPPTIHQQTARLGLAISSPIRLRALNLLAQGPWRVGELAEELGESIASTSAHLKVLRAVHMVAMEKSGRDVWCKVASPDVIQLLSAAHRAATALLPDLQEAQAKLNDGFVLQGNDFHKLTADVTNGRATLIDLRPAREFDAGHLPGAQSWPYDTLTKSQVAPLKKSPPVISYCRGPWCLKARLGVQALNRFGIPAKRLPLGVVEWQAAGFTLSQF